MLTVYIRTNKFISTLFWANIRALASHALEVVPGKAIVMVYCAHTMLQYLVINNHCTRPQEDSCMDNVHTTKLRVMWMSANRNDTLLCLLKAQKKVLKARKETIDHQGKV